MRNSIELYLNGKPFSLNGELVQMTLANFLRYERGLTGTKIVCSEGDCGACTVLLARFRNNQLQAYENVNSCIIKMYQLDRCHIVTVEGVGNLDKLHPAQAAMAKCHGTQCGYCTPGFICSMVSLVDSAKKVNKTLSESSVKNALTGNLCRCTGYEPIIKAGINIDMKQVQLLSDRYNHNEMIEVFKTLEPYVHITNNDCEVFLPATFDDLLKLKNKIDLSCIVSGATDLGVVQNKRGMKFESIIALNNIDEAYNIYDDENKIVFGAKVSLSDVEKKCKTIFPEFSNILHVFASPQIKYMGTLVGNVLNASPISDTTPFLMVAEATLQIVSSRGERQININKFFKGGYKELDISTDEIVKSISIPKTTDHFKLYKVAPRKDLDISVVTFAARYQLKGNKLSRASFAMGGVGPIVYRLSLLEKSIKTIELVDKRFVKLGDDVLKEITPLSDLRGSEKYRQLLAKNLILKFCDEVIQENGLKQQEASV